MSTYFTEFKPTISVIKEEAGEYKIDSAETVCDFYFNHIKSRADLDFDKEHLFVIALNTRLKIKGYNLVSIGTCDQSLAHPRDIFRPVIAAGAYGFVILHTHPSGEVSPSQADINLTRRIAQGANLLQINLMDHLIMGERSNDQKGYYSFKENGLL